MTRRETVDVGGMPISYLMAGKGVPEIWDKIVVKYDLRSRSLRELVSQRDQHADFAFARGAPAGPRALVNTVKLRQAGFTKVVDTEVSFRNALQSLVDHKLLPPAWKQPGAQRAAASYSEGRE